MSNFRGSHHFIIGLRESKDSTLLLVQIEVSLYSTSYGATYHRVVADAEEAHHLNVSRNRAGTCKLSVRVHTAQSVGHTVRSGTSSHVVGMEGTACTTTRGYAEVSLASTNALLLIGACNGVLEAGGVGRVTSDADVNVFLPKDSYAFANVVGTVAVHSGTRTVAVSNTLHFLQLACEVVELCLYVCEAVDAADDHGSVLAQTVEDATEGLIGWS